MHSNRRFVIYLLSLMAVTVALSACAGSGEDRGPLAKLTVRLSGDELPDAAEVDVFEGETCSQARLGGMVGTLSAAKTSLTADIPAETRMSVQVRGRKQTEERHFICSVKISLLPQAGKRYEIAYAMSSGSCTVRPTQLVRDRSGYDKRIPELTVLKNPSCKGDE